MTEEEWAREMAGEFRQMFSLVFDKHCDVMIASLVLTVRRQTLEEAASAVQLAKDTDAFHTSTKEELLDGVSTYLLTLAGATQVRQ